MAEQREGDIKLPLVWIDPETVEIQFVNQMIVQRQNEEWVLTFGQQTPPLLPPDPEERAEQAKRMGFVPVRTAVRLGTTGERLRAFVNVIQRLLEQESSEG